MVVLPQSAWEGLIEEVKEIKELIRRKSEEDFKNQWIESTDVRKILGVSQKCWKNYRDKRVIKFSQFGRKIFVKRADLDAFMEKYSKPVEEPSPIIPRIFTPD